VKQAASLIGVLLWLPAAIAAASGVELARLPDGTLLLRNASGAAALAAPASPGSPTASAGAAAARSDRYAGLVTEAAGREGLDPRLVDAVIRAESAYDPAARSHKGALGLMQLMPGTAARLAVGDPLDPAENVRGGTAYLRELLQLYEGRVDLALAGYNAGPGAVQQHGGIPPYRETRDYIARVLRFFRGAGGDDAALALPGGPVAITRSPDGLLMLTNEALGGLSSAR
jgi:soluble lytic murein transglycosylase-like protein